MLPLRTFLKSKIHRACITEANVNYEGSITIPLDLMERVDLEEGEKVLVASISNGGRLETYVLTGPRGSGRITMNGGAAHVIGAGERITIMAWVQSDAPYVSKRILCNEHNEVIGDVQ